MTSIAFLTVESTDVPAAERFYADALGVADRVRVRPAAEAPTPGFRGFTVSLTVAQPADVDALVGAALEAGGKPLKPAAKSFWGYGGVVQAPDGSIWKIATSAKKNKAPASRRFESMILLLGAENVVATKNFYADRGLTVGKSFGRKYAEFDMPSSPVKLALYAYRGLAKDAGVPAEPAAAPHLTIIGDAGPCTDPDGFVWEAAAPAED